MIHIIHGEVAATNLKLAFELDENLTGEIVVLNDHLGIGPIQLEEDKMHDAIRTEFYSTLNNSSTTLEERSKIKLLIAKAEREEEPVCFWLSPCVADVCAYYWLLPYFKNYPNMLHTINIIGLPFLNEKGQLFYPTSFEQIPAKEFVKTKRLLKEVTPAEYEVDGDEWGRLQNENTWVRIYNGGKSISSKDVTHYDILIKNSLTASFQKASKICNEVMKKMTQVVPIEFIEWRIRQLVVSESIECNGDTAKMLKDFEIKKIGSDIEEVTTIDT